MGKRRIRNLGALGYKDIIGFDLKDEKREEAEEKYKIQTFASFKDALKENPDVFIISTPPNKHNEYIKLAIENKKPAFVEASVILRGLEELSKIAKNRKVFIAPSCTFRFYPAIKKIKEIVKDGDYGGVTTFIYYMGQYLPDWHPFENIKKFYVGKKETGAAREMVAFELTWLSDILGLPKNIIGFYGKTLEMGVNINDTYALALDFGDKFGSIVVDVVSRYATRSLILNLEKAQILWRWDENFIKLYDANTKKWKKYYFKKGKSAAGYNKNITEDMYVDELKSFIESVKGKGRFSNSLNEDIKILKLLESLEKTNKRITSNDN